MVSVSLPLAIFHRGVRVASHARSHVPHRATTVTEHRPKAHQRYLEWTPSRLVDWAHKIGPALAVARVEGDEVTGAMKAAGRTRPCGGLGICFA
jgi:hypothetical protein